MALGTAPSSMFGPASTSSTRVAGSSLSRAASTPPAEPPPAMTMSKAPSGSIAAAQPSARGTQGICATSMPSSASDSASAGVDSP